MNAIAIRTANVEALLGFPIPSADELEDRLHAVTLPFLAHLFSRLSPHVRIANKCSRVVLIAELRNCFVDKVSAMYELALEPYCAQQQSQQIFGVFYDAARCDLPTRNQALAAKSSRIAYERDLTKSKLTLQRTLAQGLNRYAETMADFATSSSIVWPPAVTNERLQELTAQYIRTSSAITSASCACCGRKMPMRQIMEIDADEVRDVLPGLDRLEMDAAGWRTAGITLQVALTRLTAACQYGHENLDGLVLCPTALRLSDDDTLSTTWCRECANSLARPSSALTKVPRLALANGLNRGPLPPELTELTWAEESVISTARLAGRVVKLYRTGDPEQTPMTLRGNICCVENQNAEVLRCLPRPVSTMSEEISIVFVGKSRPRAQELRNFVRIRRRKCWDALVWLQKHNPWYADVQLDEVSMQQYPEDGVPDCLLTDLILNDFDNADAVWNQQHAGFAEHPTDYATEDIPVIESLGLIDAEQAEVSARQKQTSALRQLLLSNQLASSTNLTDDAAPSATSIDVGAGAALSEYSNPTLFCQMFPTLYPYGLGGFELKTRSSAISFQAQAKWSLRQACPSFRKHKSFVFICLNIIQRRLCHISTSYRTKSADFPALSARIQKILADPDLAMSTAKHLEDERPVTTMSAGQKEVMDVLKALQTCSQKLPGSDAAKKKARSEIRAYMGYFGVPSIFLTLNPNPIHSPMFSAMMGDTEVDLQQLIPELPSAAIRAAWVAQDPVTGAEFYQKAIDMIFEQLCGWDPATKSSTNEGGIFGQLRAFYGVSEYTDRGCLHGHFLLWLKYAPNPDELHDRLRKNPDYQQPLFSFLESTFCHHAPEGVEAEPCAPGSDTRQERPCPPFSQYYEQDRLSDLKRCVEQTQRHKCEHVCVKYGSNSCRFNFPHDEVADSYWDEETNSVVIRVRDGTVNWHNPTLLICTRHNHDCRFILSGKSAKAACCYITSYITKGELQSSDACVLINKAAVTVNEGAAEGESGLAKRFIHKALSAILRRQTIHAQQAVRYVDGFTDAMKSHELAICAMSPLLRYIYSKFGRPMDSSSGITGSRNVQDTSESLNPDVTTNHDDDDDEDLDEDQLEHETRPVRVDGQGVDSTDDLIDFIHRDPKYRNICYFLATGCLFKIPNDPHAAEGKSTWRRGRIVAPHPQAESHHLIFRECYEVLKKELVPRIVGMNIPRRCEGKDNEKYCMFMLSLFKPFSITEELKPATMTWQAAFDAYAFQPYALRVMANWRAVDECEDVRDAEQLKRRDEMMSQGARARRGARADDTESFELIESLMEGPGHMDQMTTDRVSDVDAAGWFNRDITSLDTGEAFSTNVDLSLLGQKRWKKAWEAHEKAIESSAPVSNPAASTTVYNSSPVSDARTVGTPVGTLPSTNETFAYIADKWTLNEQQRYAFDICCRRLSSEVQDADDEGLRMLLMGPGGTGKTRVVSALQDVLVRLGRREELRSMAYTATAALLIEGTTIHSGLKLDITKSRSDGTLSHTLSDAKQAELRHMWKTTTWLFIDEVSMIGLRMLAQIDYSLRRAKERDVFFGGINVIMAGDICQFPPVQDLKLWLNFSQRIARNATKGELLARYGKLAYKSFDTAITLHEQQRMRTDPEFGDAVARLRTRTCTQTDVDLFNSRAMRGADNPLGVSLSFQDNGPAMAIVDTNKVRRGLNYHKALSEARRLGRRAIVCMPRDVEVRNGKEYSIDAEEQDALHTLDVERLKDAPAGALVFFVGMPVVYRGENVSFALRVTRGMMGEVTQIQTTTLANGRLAATAIAVRFLSTVTVPGWPDKTWIFFPRSFKFSTGVVSQPGQGARCFKRYQLSVEPAYAITGHGAQGRTLTDGVLITLKASNEESYVAASRPTHRNGLFLTSRVTLSDVNKPLDSALRSEMSRLAVLQHNTLVRYGLIRAASISPMDLDRTRNDDMPILHMLTTTRVTAAVKRSAVVANLRADAPAAVRSTVLRGPGWNDTQTCAYDALTYVLTEGFNESRDGLLSADNGPELLLNEFIIYCCSTTDANMRRDFMRTLAQRGDTVGRFTTGNYVDIDDLCSTLLGYNWPASAFRTIGTAFCAVSGCAATAHSQEYQGLFPHSLATTGSAANGRWVHEIVRSALSTHGTPRESCRIHGPTFGGYVHALVQTPKVLRFDAHGAVFRISRWLYVPTAAFPRTQYILIGVIYFKNNHFQARAIRPDGVALRYDGLIQEGTPCAEGNLSEQALLTTPMGFSACTLLYALS